MAQKFLITSALPYVNGVKHLGNLAGSLLPADVFARHKRQTGAETLFICATDEHGTPAELGAAAAGQDVAVYCAEQHEIQAEIYRRLDLSFDHFGRTSAPENHQLTQDFYRALDANGFIEEREIEQVYSVADGRFLPDRYVVGTCPHCRSTAARGDQCEACGGQLDPTDLIDARSAISGSRELEVRPTRHLFLRLTALAGELETWLASRKDWPVLVTSIARKWLDEGLQDRCITRDLSWGVPVPREGFEGKVFYVWFDAPIGYVSALKCSFQKKKDQSWEAWWKSDDVHYRQFLGQDNVGFHTISFPATLLGVRGGWKTADYIKGVCWLTFESGKFSTSGRRGVFLDEAIELLPADYWRWWLTANAPETSNADFDFISFAEGVDADLAGSFGNLASRLTRLVERRYGGVAPAGGSFGQAEEQLAGELSRRLAVLRAHQDASSLRKSVSEIRAIWAATNAYLSQQAPWTVAKTDPDRAAAIVRAALGALATCARAAWPVIPRGSETILAALGEAVPPDFEDGWRPVAAGTAVGVVADLYPKLGEGWALAQAERFAGKPLSAA